MKLRRKLARTGRKSMVSSDDAITESSSKAKGSRGNLASTRVLGLRGMQEQVFRKTRWYSFGQAKRRGSKEKLKEK